MDTAAGALMLSDVEAPEPGSKQHTMLGSGPVPDLTSAPTTRACPDPPPTLSVVRSDVTVTLLGKQFSSDPAGDGPFNRTYLLYHDLLRHAIAADRHPAEILRLYRNMREPVSGSCLGPDEFTHLRTITLAVQRYLVGREYTQDNVSPTTPAGPDGVVLHSVLYATGNTLIYNNCMRCGERLLDDSWSWCTRCSHSIRGSESSASNNSTTSEEDPSSDDTAPQLPSASPSGSNSTSSPMPESQ